jgi:hypothetical protein
VRVDEHLADAAIEVDRPRAVKIWHETEEFRNQHASNLSPNEEGYARENLELKKTPMPEFLINQRQQRSKNKWRSRNQVGGASDEFYSWLTQCWMPWCKKDVG